MPQQQPMAADVAMAIVDLSNGAAAPQQPIEGGQATGRPKRRQAGRVDVDERIEHAKQKAKEAKAAVKKAVHEARNEKKRRCRLMKKAASLSVEDLQRIAKLKRAGLRDSAFGVPMPMGDPPEDGAAASKDEPAQSAPPACGTAHRAEGEGCCAADMSVASAATSPHSEHADVSENAENEP